MKDIRNKTNKELTRELFGKRKQLREFRFGTAGSKTKNVKEGRNTRKEIARILTEVNMRKNK